MMTHIIKPHNIQTAKEQAKRLRSNLAKSNRLISHSQALELVAHQFGYKDWNTFHAALGKGPEVESVGGLRMGQTVRGQYLGQEFSGELVGLQSLSAAARFRVTLHLDNPVDVVTFDSFSAMRSRISGTVNQSGVSTEKTSNGVPQLVLNLRG